MKPIIISDIKDLLSNEELEIINDANRIIADGRPAYIKASLCIKNFLSNWDKEQWCMFVCGVTMAWMIVFPVACLVIGASDEFGLFRILTYFGIPTLISFPAMILIWTFGKDVSDVWG